MINHEDQPMMITGPIALDSLPPIPWKNGGGITRTVAVEPPQAGMDDFLWRISIADLHASGSFSSFPGIDRNILLWSGAALTLQSLSWPDQQLNTDTAPFSFAGEDSVHCELTEGPSQDLNLMVRRGLVTGMLKLCDSTVRIDAPADDLVILCAQGSLQISVCDSHQYTLEAGCYLRVSHLQAEAILAPITEPTRFVYAFMSSSPRTK